MEDSRFKQVLYKAGQIFGITGIGGIIFGAGMLYLQVQDMSKILDETNLIKMKLTVEEVEKKVNALYDLEKNKKEAEALLEKLKLIDNEYSKIHKEGQ